MSNYYKHLRILAMAEVLRDQPSPEYSLRKVIRWYAEKFHTPPHVVETLPLDFLMTHHYEAQYESLIEDDIALQEELRELTMTDDEAIAAVRKKDEALFLEYKFNKEVAEDVKRGAEKAAKDKANQKPKEAPVFMAPETGTPLQMPEGRPATNLMREEEPDISMKFMDLAEFEKLTEEDSLGGGTDLTGLEIKSK